MAASASVDFPLARGLIETGDDLSGMPAGTLRYLRERGEVVDGAALSCAVAFGALAVDDEVDPADYSVNVFTRLVARGFVIGA